MYIKRLENLGPNFQAFYIQGYWQPPPRQKKPGGIFFAFF